MTAATETGMTAETEGVTMTTMIGTATAQREGGRTAIIDETAQTGETVQNLETAQTAGIQQKILMKTGMTIVAATGATNYHKFKPAGKFFFP